MKILLIEDEKMLADSLRDFLSAKGFQVEVCYDGEQGYEFAMLGIYDLLILDVMMPRLNGLQVARQVRANRVTTPILMLTAKSDVQDRIEGLNAGADYYLTKPFDTRELMACINALLRRQGHNRVQLAVTSQGESLTAQQCRDIFKRFYRVDQARKMNHSYGLGLSIAQAIVEAHKGKIWCESKNGCNTFYVNLPIHH